MTETVKLSIQEGYSPYTLSRATEQSAGIDLRSADNVIIPPGGTRVVDTGWNVSIPEGTVGLVCSRSGLAAKHGVFVLNAPGIIDSDYEGPMKVILHNSGPMPAMLEAGHRIAQLVIVPVLMPEVEVVEKIEPRSERGQGGFGSTGVI